MKRVKLVLSEVEWTMVRGILEEAEIPFSIMNEHFSSLYAGQTIGVGAFEKELLVPDEYDEQARDLLQDFFAD